MENDIRKLKVYDSDKTYDRYTVVFEEFDGIYPYYAMSSEPYHPCGICMYGELKQKPGSYLGKKIKFSSLPLSCQEFIKSYLEE